MRSKLKDAQRAADTMAANIADLKQRKAAAEAELEAINAERRQLALAGLTGDGAANKKLEDADSRATALQRSIENFGFAITEAEAQLQRLQEAIKVEQDKETAAAVKVLLAEREALAAELDNDLVALAAKFKRLMEAGREVSSIARADMGWVNEGLRAVVIGQLGCDDVLGWAMNFSGGDRSRNVAAVVRGADGTAKARADGLLEPKAPETAAA